MINSEVEESLVEHRGVMQNRGESRRGEERRVKERRGEDSDK